MVETIDKIRIKVSKLLNRIAQLEQELDEEKKSNTIFKEQFSMKMVEKKDALFEQLKSKTNPISESESKCIEQQIEHLDTLLLEMGVEPLSAPLDKLADFIKIVGTVKTPDKRNGTVAEVVKIGYLKDDELLRPTHVVIVQND